MMAGRLGAAALAAAILGSGPAVASQGGDPLASYLWRSRVLLVFAPAASDPALVRQRAVYAAMKAGARERDLALVEAVGKAPETAALRQRFGVADGAFRAILIGKDGGDKLSAETPLDADSLFPLIDAMPMRQDEMRRRS